MKATIVKIAVFAVAFAIGFVVYEGVITLLKNAESVTTSYRPSKQTTDDISEQKAETVLKRTQKRMQCIDRYIETPERFEECDTIKRSDATAKDPKKVRTFELKPKQSGVFITSLYFMMIALFALVFGIWFIDGILHLPCKLTHLSSWAVQLPPMLGVAGTMYAMATFASAKSSSGVVSLFRDNIADAVGTTIVGIAFFALNSLFFTLIQQEEYNDETE